MVRVTEHTVPFTHFLTGLCAIAGGVVTVAGGGVRWADLSDYDEGSFLVKRVDWRPDAGAIAAVGAELGLTAPVPN